MIELRSDTFTLPTRQMLEAIAAAQLGNDGYGEDPTTARLEARAAELTGKDQACFMPSGTMANLASIMAHAPRGSKILVGAESDIHVYEASGAAVCGGVSYEPLPNQVDGRILISDLAAGFPPDPDDPQFALPALICLETTHNRCGGAVLPLDYLAEVAEFARGRAVGLHLDGARLFNAAVALGVAPVRITEHVDSVQFCLSKGLGAPAGSIVAGEAGFVRRVRRIRKMLGGGMRQTGVLAAAGLVGLDHYHRLAEDHANARRLADGLARVDGIEIDPGTVTTNIVMFRLRDRRFTWRNFIQAAALRGLAVAEAGHGRLRAVTHSGVSADDVDATVAIVAGLLDGVPARVEHRAGVRTVDISQGSGCADPFPAVVAVPDHARASLLDTVDWLLQLRPRLLATVHSCGAVLLRGLPVESPAEVATVRDALCGQATGPQEPFALRDHLGSGVYSDLRWAPEQVLCPQHEQSYRLSFPQLVLLACLRAAQTGGQILLADGRQVLARLPAALVERLRDHGWIMIRNFRDRFGVPWRDAFGVTDRGGLESKLTEQLITYRWLDGGVLRTFRRRSAVIHHPVDSRPCWFNHAAFFNEYGLGLDPQERQVLREAFGRHGLTLNTLVGDGSPFTPDEVAMIEAVYDQLTVPVELAAGDLLVLDNVAVAHGRRPYTGERQVAVAMGDPVTLASCRPTVEPAGALPTGALPTGALPTGALPAGAG